MSRIPPVAVQEYGQSIWYDNIQRNMLDNGDMQKLIDEFGVLGVTSNPTIFQKAIGSGDDYDAQIAEMLDEDTTSIYEQLAVRDIQHALDLFLPVYERTNGVDGYVSLEVSPLLAHNTAETAAEAKRLFNLVNRPNLMIKIPATPEGIPAIEEALAAGVNVNITLIFSIKNYEQVMEAYLRGLERRLAAAEDISRIASVASFFLSRIDSMVDKMLENNIRAAQGRDLDRVATNRRLLGTAAIANAKLAYRRFQQIFSGARWQRLADAGARVQRPLWASTGTKNPSYSDTMYIEHLVGPHTVNTVPPATLKAFADHGAVNGATVVMGVEEAQDLLDLLAEVGIDIEEVTRRLQDDGVEAFSESFDQLMQQIEAKRNVLRTGVMGRQKGALGIYGDAVQETIRRLDEQFVNARIWAHDGSVWKDHGPTIAKIQNRLGWLDVTKTIDRARLQALQDSVKGGTWQHVVLLGMGGSSLAPEVLAKTFGAQAGFPTLLVLDSTDPQQVRDIESAITLKNTLFIVASKSGTTIESDSFYRYFYEKTGSRGEQFIAITDPGTPLEQLAHDKHFRDVFLNPADIGGRYSALSYFGLVPAALLGLDLNRIWRETERMMMACGDSILTIHHPGIWLGAVLGTLAKQGRDKLTIFTSAGIESFGNWVEQLVAESTGKEGQGIVPVVGATVGKPHDYLSDRLFVYLKIDNAPGNDALDESIRAIREAGHPRVTLMLSDPYTLAGEFFRWEFATAVAGKLLDINPFDEPNVTEAKEATRRLLDHYVAEGSLPQTQPHVSRGKVQVYIDDAQLTVLNEFCKSHNYDASDPVALLAAQIIGTRAGDYFGLLAYTPMNERTEEMFQTVRRRLRHVTRRAVTTGYGPRYLHSTGQLHKGGANHGVFFQITMDHPDDLAIPGAPYSFGVLQAAQAAGDLEALHARKIRAIRLHSDGDPWEAVNLLLEAVEFAENRRQ